MNIRHRANEKVDDLRDKFDDFSEKVKSTPTEKWVRLGICAGIVLLFYSATMFAIANLPDGWRQASMVVLLLLMLFGIAWILKPSKKAKKTPKAHVPSPPTARPVVQDQVVPHETEPTTAQLEAISAHRDTNINDVDEIIESDNLMEYHENPHTKRFVKRALHAFASVLCIFMGTLCILLSFVVDPVIIRDYLQTGWDAVLILAAPWLVVLTVHLRYFTKKQYKAKKNRQGKIESGKPDKKQNEKLYEHDSHRTANILLATVCFMFGFASFVWLMTHDQLGSLLVTVEPIASWVIGAIAILCSVCSTINAYIIFREHWRQTHTVLEVKNDKVMLYMPRNKWLNFPGGEYDIVIYRVENHFNLGTTFWERWIFTDSSRVTINGPGDPDSEHFHAMPDILHYDQLKEVIDNNRLVFIKKLGLQH